MNASPAPQNILIVCTQRIGDVLLSTPLARSIKRSFPKANVDYLVLPGTQGALKGNPDIRHVHVFAQRVSWGEKLRQFRQVWKKYDLGIAAVPTDRARLFAWAAADKRGGFTSGTQSSVQRWWLHHALPFDDLHTHTVSMNLQLLAPLGIQPVGEVVNPRAHTLTPDLHEWLNVDLPYAVLHPSPKFRYKMWGDDAWPVLGKWLQTQGLRVALTSGPDPEEVRQVQHIADQLGENGHCFAGQLDLGQTAALLAQAKVYVGPDTAVTHMAAATGIPTVALFGPSNPVKWGPWPQAWRHIESPWQMQGSQQQGNVWLLQGTDARGCVPCRLEGCDRHLDSESQCLQSLPLQAVQAAVLQGLAMSPTGT